MKTTWIAAFAATTILTVPVSASTLSETFTSYYAFGDSLTDDGKLPDFALHEVSDDGRFSNGPTWAEHIADLFTGTGANTANLAIGGATGDDENFSPINALSTFAGQVATFTASVLTGAPLPVRTSLTDVVIPQATNPGSNPLVSVLFGGNDMFQSEARAAANMTTVQEVLEDAADAVADNIRDIAALDGGNTFDDFLVLTLPGGGPADIYNAQLGLNLLDLQAEGLNIISFDTDAVFNEIVEDALLNGGGEFGVTQVFPPCTASLNEPGNPSCLDLGLDPNTIALVDPVHPNAVVHSVLGERVIAAVEASVVPLPASLPLLLAGLAGFGLLRRRPSA